SGHGVLVRRPPRPARAGPTAAVRGRPGRTRRGCAHARRAARRRSGGGRDRYARRGRLHRLPGRPGGARTGAVAPVLLATGGGAALTVPVNPPAVAVGDVLPELKIEGSPTFIAASALATRDFEDVHHDRDRAQARGSKDIFVNILTDTGLVQRYVTDWAGQKARIRSIALRLGVPWYAYDDLTLTGAVESIDDDGLVTLAVTGTDSLGKHITATVTLVMDGTEEASA